MSRVELIRERSSVKVDGKMERLPFKAFKLLEYMMTNSDRIVSRDELMDSIWSDVVVLDRTIDVHVNMLRNVVGKEKIKTYKKFGYLYESVD